MTVAQALMKPNNETRRQGDKKTRRLEQCLSFSSSPFLSSPPRSLRFCGVSAAPRTFIKRQLILPFHDLGAAPSSLISSQQLFSIT
jgi:hypothetical protein